MSPWMMQTSDYDEEWKKIDGKEDTDTYQLNYASKQAAIQ